MKKYLLLFPPLFDTSAPYLSLPILQGQLKSNGYNVKTIDLNIDFYDEILTEKFLTASLSNLYKILTDKNENLSFLNKKRKIQNFIENNPNINKLPKLINRAIKIIKEPELFYNPKFLISSTNIINKSIELVFHNYNIETLQNNISNYTELKTIIFDREQNIFIDFFLKKIKEFNMQDYDYIGISCAGNTQIIPVLTLGHYLKNTTNAHINLGGECY